LVRAWGFLPSVGITGSRKQAVAAARGRVGWNKVRLDPQATSVQFAVAGMEIDLGGIAKGYAAARAAHVLRQRGVRSALVNLGGSSMVAIGSPPGASGWPVLIRDPCDGQTPVASLALRNGEALATSGTYANTAAAGKQRRSHIIDPRTGYALGGATSVTVLLDDAELADGLTKPFFFLDSGAAANLLRSFPKASVMLIRVGRGGLMSAALGAQPSRFFLQPVPTHSHVAEAH
jgi:FAD:protein FMN transferase